MAVISRGRGDSQLTDIAFFKGINPVTHQIEHDLLDLCSVDQRRRQPFRQLHMGADALGLSAAQGKSGSLLEDGTNILELGRASRRERECPYVSITVVKP